MTQTITQPTQIKTPAAQSLELLTRIAAGIEAQNAKLTLMAETLDHLLEISDATAESSATMAEGLAKFSSAMATWTQPAVGQSVVSAPAGNTVVFMAEVIVLGYDDKGAPTYRIKGGQYSKWGVIAYPEVMGLLGVDPTTLKPGPNPFNKAVVALMGEKHPKKVIGLA